MIFAYIALAIGQSCTKTIEVTSHIEKIEENITSDGSLCISGKKYFYLLFNLFDSCEITVDYLSSNYKDVSIKQYVYKDLSFNPPFIDFSEKDGTVKIIKS